MEELKREGFVLSPRTSVTLFVCVGLLSFLATCGTPQETDRTPPVAAVAPVTAVELASLGEQVREIIRPGCGSCHTSTLPTAKPGAIAIFDLAQTDFAGTMTVEHLESFGRRLRKLEEPERGLVQRFVSAQIANRAAPGAEGTVERTVP